jgi:protein tyrosine phosphatase domain-containing protein 1
MKCKFCFFSCYKKKKENKKKKKISISREISIILKDKSELIKLDESIIKNPKLNNTTLFRGNDSSLNKRITTTSKVNEITESVILKKPTKSSSEKNKKNKKKSDFIHEFKDKIRCFFCGGKNCKYENYLNNIKNNNAIIGLNSNYITDNLIASQRPSEILINKYNLVEQFKQHNIGLIINLEREGEHPFCGPNAYHLTPSGYSYNPSIFTGNEIICRFYGWKDMSTPSSLSFMIEIVKDITIMIREEKKNVLVHCHDGNGRSGVVIACYLIFNSHDTNVWDIIKNVRKHRINAIYTRAQEKFCKKFYDYVSHIRTLFNDKTPKEKIETFLRSQDDFLCGKEILDIGIVPILLKKCLRKILNISRKYNLNNIHIYQVIGEYSDSNLSIELNKILCVLKESINNSNWNLFYKTENLHIIIALLFQWLTDYVLFLICPQRTEKLIQNSHFIDIENFVNEKLGQIEELTKMIKNDFYCYEYETIYNIAKFARHFLPTNSLEENCYKQMLDSFSLRLLGYKMVDVYKKEIFNNVKKIVTGLSTIIEFMVISINLFKGNDDNNPFVIPQKKLSIRNKIQNTSMNKRYSKYSNVMYDSPKKIRNVKKLSENTLSKPNFTKMSKNNNFINSQDKRRSTLNIELGQIPEKERNSNSKSSHSNSSISSN